MKVSLVVIRKSPLFREGGGAFIDQRYNVLSVFTLYVSLTFVLQLLLRFIKDILKSMWANFTVIGHFMDPALAFLVPRYAVHMSIILFSLLACRGILWIFHTL